MSTTVGVVSPTGASKRTLKDFVSKIIESGFYLGKVPLFVLGAGISARRVPLIGEMANRLVTLLGESKGIPESTRENMILQGERISAGQASRSDAAEFFSTCQIDDTPMRATWDRFCRELSLEGLPNSDRSKFSGLFRLTAEPDEDETRKPLCGPSLAHIGIANLMTVGACHVLNLNYDPLLFLAMSYLRQAADGRDEKPSYHIVSLHTEEDIIAYYSSASKEYQPAVINARGDIFYARCSNNRCPDFTKTRSLDTRYAIKQERKEEEAFRCSCCHLKTIQLQLSFPGYETKERLLEPVLHRLRDFLGNRVSIILPVGLSGQWDPYLLSEIFDWSLAYSIPIVDVKPDTLIHTAFEAFRHRYFPSIPVGAREEGAWYQQWPSTADEFMNVLDQLIRASEAFTLDELAITFPVGQPALPLG